MPSSVVTETPSDWQTWIDESVAIRRDLHRRPELSWSEERTAEVVRTGLDALGITWRACARTGSVATLAAGARGRHVALRADMDALPIEEKTELPWASQTPGCMHACGHDGHTATLLLVARLLKARERELPGPVTLLFQPAEEGGHGAKRMIEEGALRGVDVIFGWHNWPAIPLGRAMCPDGTVMAGNGAFEILVKGQGGHASQPEHCKDPVLSACAIVMSLQQIVSRRLPPHDATILSVTSIDARSGVTIIPDQAKLAGSFRIESSAQREPLIRMLTEIATDTARAYGTECEVIVHPRYEPTVNHAAPASEYRAALLGELGPSGLDASIRSPVMASEDFSYYLREIPGAFALVGAGDAERAGVPCHSPHYDFNDALIPHVARIFAELAFARASSSAP